MEALTIGSPAPVLKGVHWLQGEPVTGYEPGRLYVVEFWSTWCGPCRATIPKLSQIAASFKDTAVVVGVDIFEQGQGTEENIRTVEEFVEKMGPKMTYRVLIDGQDQFMANEWMRRSGRTGIPSAFVVDGEGKIAWMGHPANGLENVLADLNAGTYVPKEEAEPSEMDRKMAAAQKELDPFLAALAKKDFRAAMAAADELVRNSPRFQGSADMLRFQAASVCGKSSLVRETLAEFESNEANRDKVWVLASMLAHAGGLDQDIYATAIGLMKQFFEEMDEDQKEYLGMYYDSLAGLFFHSGDLDGAIEMEEMSVEEWKRKGEMGERMASICEGRLEEFIEAKNSRA